jgi:uncharacterized membrane protein YhaH (DUF805 family)
VSFGQAISSFWKNYVNFKGRARRSEYWWAYLFMVLASVGTIFVDGFMRTFSFDLGVGIFSSLFFLSIILPSISITVRRLHDTNRNGWWYLISFIPFVGAIVIFIFTLLDSAQGSNNWGPSPKYGGAQQTSNP